MHHSFLEVTTPHPPRGLTPQELGLFLTDELFKGPSVKLNEKIVDAFVSGLKINSQMPCKSYFSALLQWPFLIRSMDLWSHLRPPWTQFIVVAEVLHIEKKWQCCEMKITSPSNVPGLTNDRSAGAENVETYSTSAGVGGGRWQYWHRV